ncbi:hypothetical protein K438DRAFT_1938339 [Mycena galopus ATCC 62051]|nr:hypothetical protein K438DRAFT_1938339 [Mycena galopus ATCC 62051]
MSGLGDTAPWVHSPGGGAGAKEWEEEAGFGSLSMRGDLLGVDERVDAATKGEEGVSVSWRADLTAASGGYDLKTADVCWSGRGSRAGIAHRAGGVRVELERWGEVVAFFVSVSVSDAHLPSAGAGGVRGEVLEDSERRASQRTPCARIAVSIRVDAGFSSLLLCSWRANPSRGKAYKQTPRADVEHERKQVLALASRPLPA